MVSSSMTSSYNNKSKSSYSGMAASICLIILISLCGLVAVVVLNNNSNTAIVDNNSSNNILLQSNNLSRRFIRKIANGNEKTIETENTKAINTTKSSSEALLQPTNTTTISERELFNLLWSRTSSDNNDKLPTPQPSKDCNPTKEPTDRPNCQPTKSPTESPTYSPTCHPTKSPTNPPTYYPTVPPTASPTATPTLSPSLPPTASPTSLPTPSPTATPTLSPSVSPTASPTASPTPSPTATPTSFPSVQPTSSPTATPTPMPTYLPTKRPTQEPTIKPTPYPDPVVTPPPTAVKSFVPSSTPSFGPTQSPSDLPTEDCNRHPSTYPSVGPSHPPSSFPTESPTPPTRQPRPTASPSTLQPDPAVTPKPTIVKSSTPSSQPTTGPSFDPTESPSDLPTEDCNRHPSTIPSVEPSYPPTTVPSFDPTQSPSHLPTEDCNRHPSTLPSVEPSHPPSSVPTTTPTSPRDPGYTYPPTPSHSPVSCSPSHTSPPTSPPTLAPTPAKDNGETLPPTKCSPTRTPPPTSAPTPAKDNGETLPPTNCPPTRTPPPTSAPTPAKDNGETLPPTDCPPTRTPPPTPAPTPAPTPPQDSGETLPPTKCSPTRTPPPTPRIHTHSPTPFPTPPQDSGETLPPTCHRPSQEPTPEPECTELMDDAWKTGKEIPCCGELIMCLSDWIPNQEPHYRCVQTCPPTMKPTQAPTPPADQGRTQTPSMSPTHECKIDAEIACFLNDEDTGRVTSTTCSDIPSGGLCSPNDDTIKLKLKFTGKACAAGSNSQEGKYRCFDYDKTKINNATSVVIACAGNGTTLFTDKVNKGDTFVVGNSGNPLPESIVCNIEEEETELQVIEIDTSKTLKPDDSFGALKLKSCLERDGTVHDNCSVDVTYVFTVKNMMEDTEVEITKANVTYGDGDTHNCLLKVDDSTIPPRYIYSCSDTLNQKIDVCDDTEYKASFEVQGSTTSGKICTDNDEYMFSFSTSPSPTPYVGRALTASPSKRPSDLPTITTSLQPSSKPTSLHDGVSSHPSPVPIDQSGEFILSAAEPTATEESSVSFNKATASNNLDVFGNSGDEDEDSPTESSMVGVIISGAFFAVILLGIIAYRWQARRRPSIYGIDDSNSINLAVGEGFDDDDDQHPDLLNCDSPNCIICQHRVSFLPDNILSDLPSSSLDPPGEKGSLQAFSERAFSMSEI